MKKKYFLSELDNDIKWMESTIKKYEKVVGKNKKAIIVGSKIAITTKFPFLHII